LFAQIKAPITATTIAAPAHLGSLLELGERLLNRYPVRHAKRYRLTPKSAFGRSYPMTVSTRPKTDVPRAGISPATAVRIDGVGIFHSEYETVDDHGGERDDYASQEREMRHEVAQSNQDRKYDP
jgi:hypothetical protein